MVQDTDSLPTAIDVDRSHGRMSFRWVICLLLFLATTINYMDRQVLGLLAPFLEKAIGWNELQYGHIVVAFQAAYAIGQLGFGWLIDRWGTKKGYALAMVAWCVAAAGHGLAGSVTGFMTARFALGLGEAGNFPAAIKAVSEWFPKRERALATGLFNSGSTVGAILAPFAVSAISAAYGWQAAFVALGAIGLLWLLLWLLLYDRPEDSPRVTEAELAHIRSDDHAGLSDVGNVAARTSSVNWGRLLTLRQTWAYSIQALCVQPIWWFYLFWLPKFFHSRFGLELQKSAPLLAVTYAMSMVGSISAGALSAWLLKRGWSVNAARKIALLVCALVTVPMVEVTRVNNAWTATLLIGLALGGMQGWSANAYTIVSDLFPKGAVASIVGLGSACGSAVAMLLALLVGAVLQRSGSYHIPFFIAGVSLPVAIMLVHLMVPRWDPVELNGLE